MKVVLVTAFFVLLVIAPIIVSYERKKAKNDTQEPKFEPLSPAELIWFVDELVEELEEWGDVRIPPREVKRIDQSVLETCLEQRVKVPLIFELKDDGALYIYEEHQKKHF